MQYIYMCTSKAEPHTFRVKARSGGGGIVDE
jgi:hypothetical protein